VAVQIPIELLALNAEFNKKIKNSTASVSMLDAEVKILNKDIKKTATSRNIKNVTTFDSKIKTLGKSYNVSSKQIQIATDKNQSAVKRLAATITVLSKSFRFLRNIIIPLGLALFAGTKLLNRFRITSIASILALRITIIKSLILIRIAFNRLAKSRSITEFGVNLVRLGRLSNQSFNEIIDGARRAGEQLSDPSLVKDFLDFTTRSIIKVGVLAFTLKKLGPFIFGTSSLLKQFARSSVLVGTFASLASLRINLFTQSLKTNNAILKIGLRGIQFITQAAVNFTTAFVRFGNVLERSGSVLIALNRTGLRPFSNFIRQSIKNTSQLGKAVSASAKQTELFSSSLFGATSRVSVFGVGLVGLGVLLKQSENGFIRFLGSVFEFVGLLLGPVNLLVSRLLAVIGSLIRAVGTTLVNANQRAAASFQAADLASFTFLRTLRAFGEEFPKVVGTTAQWNKEIEILNKTTGVTTASLRFIVAELIETGTSLGLSTSQIKLLTRASVDFAAQIKGDSTQAVLDLVSALNGNSRSVQKYGLQLTAASVQQFLFNEGITKTFASMNEQEKVQARLQALMKTYSLVAGIAAEQTSTFAGTSKLLEGRLQTLAVTFGEGANVVENFAVGERLLIGVIDELNPLVVKTAGFFSGLAGRALQVIGIFFQLVFTVALVTTSIKALNVLLASQAFRKGFFAKIPIFNGSLASLAKALGVTNLRITSIGGVIRAVGQIFVAQTKRMVAGILGVEVATLTWASALKLARLRVIQLTRATLKFLANPAVLVFIAIAAAVIILVKGLIALEQRTKAISSIFNAVVGLFGDLLTNVFGVTNIFSKLISIIGVGLRRAFGLLVLGLATVIRGIATALANLPDAVASAERKISFQKAADRLGDFQRKLITAGLDFDKLGEDAERAGRSIASVFTFEGQAALPKNLQTIARDIQKSGKTELDLLRIQAAARLKIVVESFKLQKVSREQAAELSLAISADLNRKEQELAIKQREKLKSIAERFGGAAAIQERLTAELEQLRLANQAKLLTNEEFELAQTVAQIQADQKRIEAKINNELLVTDLIEKTHLERLQFQKKILEAEIAAQNAAGVNSIVARKKLAAINGQINAQELSDQRTFLSTAATLAQSNSSVLAAIGKAAAITQIAIKTPTAVASSFEFGTRLGGPPLGFLFGGIAATAMAAQAARVAGIALQTGITSIPSGFPNDSFPARLTTGERVVNVPQNRDLTNFLDAQATTGGDSQTDLLKQVVEGLNGVMELLTMGNITLEEKESEIIVQIGGKEITRVIREELRSGRSLAV